MTEYFEIGDRDGAARRGTLRLTDAVSTPAAVDDIVVDAGSRWHEPQSVPDGDESTLTVLPHRALPPGTEPPVEEAFAVDYPDVDYPSAAVVSPETATDHGADAYVLSTAQAVDGHAEAFGTVADELESSVEAYDEMTDEFLAAMDEQLDMLVEAHEELEVQSVEATEEVAGQVEELQGQVEEVQEQIQQVSEEAAAAVEA